MPNCNEPDLIEPVFTVPERCDDRDCPHEWHLFHYALDADGQWWASGETMCEREMVDAPSEDDVAKAWRNYTLFVLASGTDPLGHFGVSRTRKRMARCVALFSNSITGVRVLEVRLSGRVLDPVPSDIAAFLCVVPRKNGPLHFDGTWHELCQLPQVRIDGSHARVRCLIERETPRPERSVKRDLRRAARLSLS